MNVKFVVVAKKDNEVEGSQVPEVSSTTAIEVLLVSQRYETKAETGRLNLHWGAQKSKRKGC